MVGYHKRFDPAYLRARPTPCAAWCGLRYVEVTVLHPDDAPTARITRSCPRRRCREPRRRRSRPRDCGARSAPGRCARAAWTPWWAAGAPLHIASPPSILFESLIHDINALRGMLGEPEEVLSAHVWRGRARPDLAHAVPGRRARRLSAGSRARPASTTRSGCVRGPARRVTLTFPSPYLRHVPTPLRSSAWTAAASWWWSSARSRTRRPSAPSCTTSASASSGARAAHRRAEALGDARWIEAIARAFGKSPQPVAGPGVSSRRPARRSRARTRGPARPRAGSRA